MFGAAANGTWSGGQESTYLSGSLGGGVGYMCAGRGCVHQVRVENTTESPWTRRSGAHHGTVTLSSGDAVFCASGPWQPPLQEDALPIAAGIFVVIITGVIMMIMMSGGLG